MGGGVGEAGGGLRRSEAGDGRSGRVFRRWGGGAVSPELRHRPLATYSPPSLSRRPHGGEDWEWRRLGVETTSSTGQRGGPVCLWSSWMASTNGWCRTPLSHVLLYLHPRWFCSFLFRFNSVDLVSCCRSMTSIKKIIINYRLFDYVCHSA